MDNNWVGGLRDSGDQSRKLENSMHRSKSPKRNTKKDEVCYNQDELLLTAERFNIEAIKINQKKVPMHAMKKKGSPKKVRKDIFDEVFDNVKPDEQVTKQIPVSNKIRENSSDKKRAVYHVPIGESKTASFVDDQMKIDFQNKLKADQDMGIISEMPSLDLLISPLVKMVTEATVQIDFLFDPARDIENGDAYYKDGDIDLYSTEAMTQRKALKQEQIVKKRINTFMSLFRFDNKTKNYVEKESYFEIFTKIADLFHPNMPKSQIEDLVQLDWEHDSKESDVPINQPQSNQISRRDTAAPSHSNFESESNFGGVNSEMQSVMTKEEDNRYLTKGMLFDSLFELADQWTPDISAGQIVAMYNTLEDKIKYPDLPTIRID